MATILDNLSSHEDAGTKSKIEFAAAELLFLAPYSPDLKPIEMVFAKAKQLLRLLGCRSREASWTVMQSVLDQISTSNAASRFRLCGYTLHLDQGRSKAHHVLTPQLVLYRGRSS